MRIHGAFLVLLSALACSGGDRSGATASEEVQAPDSVFGREPEPAGAGAAPPARLAGMLEIDPGPEISVAPAQAGPVSDVTIGLVDPAAGVVLPIFTYRAGQWSPVQLDRDARAPDSARVEWTPPDGYYILRGSNYLGFEVASPSVHPEGILQHFPGTGWPGGGSEMVVSNPYVEPFEFHDHRDHVFIVSTTLQMIAPLLEAEARTWIERWDAVDLRGPDAVGPPPTTFRQLQIASGIHWRYVHASRAYGRPPGSSDERCWHEVGVAGWIRVTERGDSLVEHRLNGQMSDCEGKGRSHLSILGGLRIEGRDFVVAQAVEWESRIPLVIELTDEGPAVVSRSPSLWSF